jgi:hypothetical protein
MAKPLDTRGLDAFIAGLDLYVEVGVLVELDQFLQPGWSYRRHDRHVEVEGPDDRHWVPGVGRLIRVVSYTRGSLHRATDDGSIELVCWRARDGRGFRIVFKRRASAQGQQPREDDLANLE